VFVPLSARETLEELEMILTYTNCTEETTLRSNHASNWLALAGVLPQDKARMLEQVRDAMLDTSVLRSDEWRRL
jgi:hypothetical protein